MIFNTDDLEELNNDTVNTDEYIEKVLNSIGNNKENIVDKIDLLMMERDKIFDNLNTYLEGDYEEKILAYMKLIKVEQVINDLEIQLSMLKHKEKEDIINKEHYIEKRFRKLYGNEVSFDDVIYYKKLPNNKYLKLSVDSNFNGYDIDVIEQNYRKIEKRLDLSKIVNTRKEAERYIDKLNRKKVE